MLAPRSRIASLDALRGFAILTMVLSGVIPYGNLPPWMYHAQLPPPDHVFQPDLPGLTWVDLVFPLFLFALGAALPLALSRRLEQGRPLWRLILDILERGVLLGFFAIFLRHVRPHVMDPSPQAIHWWIALLGFILMFAIFVRLPRAVSNPIQWTVRGIGWGGAILLLVWLRYPDGSGFSLGRHDIIIIVLTNMAVFGALIWLITRHRLLLRIGVLGILLALRLSHDVNGWTQVVWTLSPIPWIFKVYYLQYLFIVIPGTIAGDLLLRQSRHMNAAESGWTRFRWVILGVLLTGIVLTLLVGLQSRWIAATVLLTMVLLGMALVLTRQAKHPLEQLCRACLHWGAYCVVLGLTLEPFEGGIKKDHPTLSYYFVTAGMAFLALIVFTIVIERFNKQRGPVRLLVHNGKNPMIAYVAFANVMWPILALTGLDPIITSLFSTPWLGVLKGVTYTLVVALFVSVFSRHKLYWRT
jgi:predicted acyltransferase